MDFCGMNHRFGLSTTLLFCLSMRAVTASTPANILSTGQRLTPVGSEVGVGSFPVNMALTPDGKYIVVTDSGFRQHLTVIRAETGKVTSVLGTAADGKSGRLNLYYGLATSPVIQKGTGDYSVYVSNGSADTITRYDISPDGILSQPRQVLKDTSSNPEAAGAARPSFPAGLCLSSYGRYLYAANNETSQYTDYKASVSIFNTRSGELVRKVVVPGFPLAVAAVTAGKFKDQKVYTASELTGTVTDIAVADPTAAHVLRSIKTGDHPVALLLNANQSRLFVANAGSDTVSEIDTATDHIVATISLRSSTGLPGVTPTGLALSPHGNHLYVTLAGKNEVAVVDGPYNGRHPRVVGAIPTGWYPTAVNSVNGQLYILNAKGGVSDNPNGSRRGPAGRWGHYILNILQGSVQELPVPSSQGLAKLTRIAARNNAALESAPLPHTGIKHIIYIIKENRTYDQVLGDLPQGNGDPALCIFGRKITPNLHALALRFVLLDNFYCSSEVSPDGWNWSTSANANDYVERNVPYNYSGRGRNYDFEGETNGIPMRTIGEPDVASSSGGYLWDDANRSGITYRNYGFFVSFGTSRQLKSGKIILPANHPVEPNLVGHTDDNFLRFDLSYADSDAWVKYHCPAPKQMKTYGAHHETCRFNEWLREFKGYVRHHDLPALEMVRLMRDHTDGTSPGLSTPSAMVADNDYAVGELVQAVSHSPYWKSTAICVVEDDAQDGYDHVDCHRSEAYIISPYIRQNSVDHHFYNTVSMLHTMESLLHMPPLTRFDAGAPVIHDFTSSPTNDAPFVALLPARSVISAVSVATAYGARRSAAMDFAEADANPEQTLNKIIWRSVRGRNAPIPAVVHNLDHVLASK
jgi:YVTN family beta-propeller protein